MFGVFDFMFNTCKYFVDKGESPSMELTMSLYSLLKTPEFESELKYLSETNPKKVNDFVVFLRKSLKKMDKDK